MASIKEGHMETKHLWKKMYTVLVATSFVLAIQSLSSSTVWAATIYVDSNATGSVDGSSWANAYTDLQNAINSATTGDEVWVASSTYYPTSTPNLPTPPTPSSRYYHFSLKNGVAVYGGFAGTETQLTQRDFELNPTYLSGDVGIQGDRSDNCYHVFFHDSLTGETLNNTAVLDGFAIIDGNADSTEANDYIHNNGGGMYNHETSPTIRYCLFTNNSSATSASSVNGGGAMHNYYGSPIIENCQFVNNTTSGKSGGALYNNGGTPQIRSSTFTGNIASDINLSSGGAIGLANSNAVITGCTFNDNTAYREGGAISNISSSPIFTNCTFDNNQITNGLTPTTIFNSGGAPNFTNCTVTGANSLSSNAMYSYNSNPVVKNSIFRTGAYDEFKHYGTGTTTVTYSVLTNITNWPGTGNTQDDPLLDATGLQDNGGPVETIAIGVGGSAEDSGTATGAPATDARGVARQTPPSIGAYELISYTVGGTVSGLASGNEVVLQNNGADDTTITIDTIYTFATAVENGKSYDVTVLTQPSGVTRQLCTAEGSGIINDSNITNADVLCVNTYTIGGSVTGLAAGNEVVLQNNSGDDLTVSSNGTFTFATALADGSAYSATVLTDPTTPNQTCTVTSGSGSLSGGDVSNVSIACVTETYTIGGSVTGLATGNSVVLQNNSGDNLTVSANSTFTFSTAIDDGSAYSITVLTQPTTPNQTCTVINGSGTLAGADVSNVSISCVTNTYTTGGSVTGLATGNEVVLQNNGGDNLTVSSNGSFTFATALADGSNYTVTVSTQPTTPNQTCTVTNESGTVAGDNVTTVSIACVTETYTIGGSVTGLADGSGVILQNNSSDDLLISANGAFTFSTALDDGSNYNVTILAQPPSEKPQCRVVGGSGILSGTNVTNIKVTCGGFPWTMFLPALTGGNK